MQVTQYTYQSPYTSPVQFGKVDPSTKQEQSTQTDQLLQNNQSAVQAQELQATQTQEVKPSVTQNSLLDVYA
ncbi:MAG: hypothetical protein JXQ67_00700 [Campylobacterales bacterium]|nr:hypothetical protein [Campylobacterales bacterium]